MKRAKQIVFGIVAASGTAWGVVACESIPIAPTMDCGAYAGVGYWHAEEPPSVTVCLGPDAESAELEFKDNSGTPIPGGGHVSAGGCLTVPKPPGAAYVDWLASPQSAATEQALTVAPLLHWVRPVPVLLDHGQQYLIGCAPLQASPTDKVLAYAFKVSAASAAEAKSKVSPLVSQGPGTVVPTGVTVGEYIEAEMVGSDLVIRSSLADRFADFGIDINGDPVADLETGLNVEITGAGQGWMTVTTTLPLASLPESFSLGLQQRGQHDPDEVQVSLTF